MAKCKSCQAEIIWVLTHKGNRACIDAAPAENGNLVLEMSDEGGTTRPVDPLLDKPPYYISHHATCPQGPDWRMKR